MRRDLTPILPTRQPEDPVPQGLPPGNGRVTTRYHPTGSALSKWRFSCLPLDSGEFRPTCVGIRCLVSPGEHGRRLPGASVPRISPPQPESLADYRSTSERFTHLLNPFALFLSELPRIEEHRVIEPVHHQSQLEETDLGRV